MLSVSDASLRSIARRHGTEFVATVLNQVFFGNTINANTDTMDETTKTPRMGQSPFGTRDGAERKSRPSTIIIQFGQPVVFGAA
jgi:hypothetical protein